MARAVIFLLVLSFFISCKSKDSNKGISDDVYQDYKIIAEEGNDNLVATAQFRNEDGDALGLQLPASITLDGQPMEADSSKYTGYTYEAYRAIDSFNGSHTFTYINKSGKKSEATFEFATPALVSTFPDTVSRADLELQFTGLEEKATVRMVMIDTSAINEELNQVETVENGRLLIPATSFETISTGPVQLELAVESEKKLDAGKQGRILITYTLRREFFLKD